MPSFDERVPFGSFGRIDNKGTPIARTRVSYGDILVGLPEMPLDAEEDSRGVNSVGLDLRPKGVPPVVV